MTDTELCPPRFNHVAMSVTADLLQPAGRAELTAFYGDVFGWQELPTETVDGQKLVFGVHTVEQFVFLIADDPPMTCPRLDHYGLSVQTEAELDAVLAKARAWQARDERVDIILYDENPAQFVINAMSPAEVLSIVVDEDTHTMDLAVDEEKLSQAIGRGGQNIRLASELSGWQLNVMTESAAEEKSDKEARSLVENFMKDLDVDEDVANILVQEGFSSLEEIAYVPASELNGIEEFTPEIVNELRSRARDVLITQALVSEEVIDQAEPAEDLLSLEGMDKTLALELASRGVVTREDLAELGHGLLRAVLLVAAQEDGVLPLPGALAALVDDPGVLKGGQQRQHSHHARARPIFRFSSGVVRISVTCGFHL